MKVVVQRCKNANVTVDKKVVGSINEGYLLLVGFKVNDDESTVKKMAKKIINLRVFEDEDEKMNLDINQINGSILSISQFTLYAKLDGRRPSFSMAMPYNDAKELYHLFNEELKNYGIKVETGIFGADMKVNLLNDGPVTIIIDSEEEK